MCELLGMSARFATSLSLSLTELARHGGGSGPHADGWGVVFYEGRDVRMIREPRAAVDSPFMELLRAQRIESTLVMCHIRKATQGGMSLPDTHPFRRELGGRIHTFAHNGDLNGLADEPRFAMGRRFLPVGQTDSERAFCVLLHRLQELWDAAAGDVPPLSARTEIVAELAAQLRPLGPANFLYSDGDVMFAHGHIRTQEDGVRRPPGLHVLCRTCRRDDPRAPLVGVELGRLDAQVVALVASVPLSSEGWRPLGSGELVVMRDGVATTVDP